jgi:hypothetical protein
MTSGYTPEVTALIMAMADVKSDTCDLKVSLPVISDPAELAKLEAHAEAQAIIDNAARETYAASDPPLPESSQPNTTKHATKMTKIELELDALIHMSNFWANKYIDGTIDLDTLIARELDVQRKIKGLKNTRKQLQQHVAARPPGV